MANPRVQAGSSPVWALRFSSFLTSARSGEQQGVEIHVRPGRDYWIISAVHQEIVGPCDLGLIAELRRGHEFTTAAPRPQTAAKGSNSSAARASRVRDTVSTSA